MSLQGFASRLRAARAAANLTQKEVGDALGYTADTIANYERGRTEPSLVDVRHLATLYGVTCAYLMSGTPGSPGLGFCSHGRIPADRCLECEQEAATA